MQSGLKVTHLFMLASFLSLPFLLIAAFLVAFLTCSARHNLDSLLLLVLYTVSKFKRLPDQTKVLQHLFAHFPVNWFGSGLEVERDVNNLVECPGIIGEREEWKQHRGNETFTPGEPQTPRPRAQSTPSILTCCCRTNFNASVVQMVQRQQELERNR